MIMAAEKKQTQTDAYGNPVADVDISRPLDHPVDSVYGADVHPGYKYIVVAGPTPEKTEANKSQFHARGARPVPEGKDVCVSGYEHDPQAQVWYYPPEVVRQLADYRLRREVQALQRIGVGEGLDRKPGNNRGLPTEQQTAYAYATRGRMKDLLREYGDGAEAPPDQQKQPKPGRRNWAVGVDLSS